MSFFPKNSPPEEELIDEIIRKMQDGKVKNLFRDEGAFCKSGDNMKPHLDDLSNKSYINTNTNWEHAYSIPVKIEKSNENHSSNITPKVIPGNSVVDAGNYINKTSFNHRELKNNEIHKNMERESDTEKQDSSVSSSNENCISKEKDDKDAKRLDCKIERTPVNAYEATKSNDSNNDGMGGSKNRSDVTDKKKFNVKHTLPIFVEGRKDPIYPKTNIKNQSPVKQKSDCTPNTKGKSDIEKPKPTPKKPNPLDQIKEIEKDVNELAVKVEKLICENRSDKKFVYLDEMLTRNLIKLDVIEVGADDNIRAMRKNAIKSIQKCIALLESKVSSETHGISNDVEMDYKAKTNNSVSETLVQNSDDFATPEIKGVTANVKSTAQIIEAETKQPVSDKTSESKCTSGNEQRR